MSDTGRKDFTDKAQEKLTPESQKTVGDKASESVTGAYDKVAAAVQPDSEKTPFQSVADSLSGSAKPGEKGVVEQVTDTVNAGVKYVSDAAADVYNKVTEQTK